MLLFQCLKTFSFHFASDFGYFYVHISSSSLDRRDDDQKMGNIADFVHEIWRNAFQTIVGKVTRWEDVNDIVGIETAWIGDVDNASSLFLLQIVDEADFEIFSLSHHVGVIEAAW